MLTLPIVLDAALKVALLLALAGLVTALMQKQSASARHAVWSFAVIAALAIPSAEGILPSWKAELVQLPAPVAVKVAPAQIVESPLPHVVSTPAPSVERVASPVASETRTVPTRTIAPIVGERHRAFTLPTFTTAQILFAVWALGFLAAFVPLAVGIIRVKAFARRATRGLSPLWQETLDQLPASARPSRNVVFMESSETSMPLACGLFSPVVIVPGNAERWPAWKRRNILVHELAHVQRFDCLTQALATLLCSLYWFNPLAWAAASRMRIERELACDDKVLEAGSGAADYADHLLEVARSLRPAPGTAMAAIAMARSSNLSMRLVAVLDNTRSRGGLSRRGAGLLGAVSLLLMLPLAAFKPWKSESITQSKASAQPAPAIGDAAAFTVPTNLNVDEQPAIELGAAALTTSAINGLGAPLSLDPKAAPAVALAPLAVPSSLAVCADAKSSSTHINQDDDGVQSLTLKYSSGDDCSLEIVANGKFTFADDLTDVASLSSGATMTIKETNHGAIRKLDIRSVGGAIQRQFYINGVPSAFGDNERRWLADILLAVERRTAFSAKTRVPRLFENGGVNGVLSEVSQMTSSYPKRVYLEALFDIGINFDGPTLAKITRIVGTEFDSDYERRLMLARMPSQKFMDENSWNAFADAVARMGSDYEKRLVITEAFDKRQLSAAVAAKLISSVSTMKSSYEIGLVLKGPALSYASNPAVRPAYVAAVRRMTSDYELRQVLVALIEQTQTNGSMAELLEPARTIQSDYERGQVIAAFADHGQLNADAITTLSGLAGGMKSDYEKHKALKAIISSKPRIDSRGLSQVLTVAGSIGSDYELSTFLKEVLGTFPSNAIPRDAFDRALQSIGSSSEANAVRAAMQ